MASNVANFKRFARSLDREVDRVTERELVVFHKRIALDTFARLLLRSPVDTGHLRARWQISIGVAPAGEGPDRPSFNPGTDPTPAVAAPDIGKALSALGALAAFSVVYIRNDAPYAQVVDEGLFEPPSPGPSKDRRKGRFGRVLVRSGFSTQAPQGMTNVVVAEILAQFP